MKIKKVISFLTAGILALSGISIHLPKANAETTSRVSVHDPSIIKDPVSKQYYLFGSHIDAAKSTDLQNWVTFTNGYTTPNNVEFGDLSHNLKKAFDWCGEDLEDCKGGFAVWAPDVIWNPEYINADGSKGAYVMYFCTSSTYIRSVICYAVSKNIEGPYQFVDTLIYTGFTANDQYVSSDTRKVNKKYTSTNIDELIASGEVAYNPSWFSGSNYNNNAFPNAIDPTIYYDTNGKMYMVYGSWSGGIFTLEIDPKTGKCIHPKTGKTTDGRMVDSYFGTKLIGGYHKSGEGPFIEYNEETGYYYLWVTFGGLLSEGGYNMRVYRSKNPLGPFEDPAGNNGIMEANSNLDSCGLKVMGNYQFNTNDKAYMACGHNSVLKDEDGSWYLFYHARFDDGTEFHQVRVHSMQFNEQGWPVVAPNEYQGDSIDSYGYEASDIAGTYEFINHGNDTGSKVYHSSEITLTNDGNISGAVSGTWSENADSNDAVLTIGSQKYYGKFIAAKDEKGKKVMSFTAVGNNNQTIWGNRTSVYIGSSRNNSHETGSFIDGSAYTIKNAGSNLYMEVAGNIAENNTNVQQWDLNGGDSENTNIPDKWNTWRLFDAGDGYYYIISGVGDGATYALDVAGKKAANGVNIGIYQFDGGENQKFKFIKNSNGSYKIYTKISNEKSVIEAANGSLEYGANIQQWSENGADCQNWFLEPATVFGTEMDTNALYHFSNANSGLVMDIENGNMTDGTNVRQWESNASSCQEWKLVSYGGDKNYYFINSCMNEKYGLCIESNGNLGIKAHNDANPNMLFQFVKNFDGTYLIMPASSDRVLEVENAGTAIGENIQQWDMNGNQCQKWNVVAYEASASKGDVNADGSFNIADVVLLQKWLLAIPEVRLANWKAADFCEDSVLNGFDLCEMKRRLVLGDEKAAFNQIYVQNTEELKNALENARPGDEIILAEGEYIYSGTTSKGYMFTGSADGTGKKPIIIRSENPEKPAVISGSSTSENYALSISGDWWEIRDLKITNAQKGIMLDNSSYTKIINCEVYDIGSEGIHLRDNSSYCLIENCNVHDTGIVSPGYGEAVYIGSAKSTTGYGYECHYNTIRNCRLGPNVAAEHVDIKEYTIGTTVENCMFDGTGMRGENFAKSFINIKGNDCVIKNNVGYRNGCVAVPRAFEQNNVVDGWGQNATIYGNQVYMDTATNTLGKKMYFLNAWDCSATVWDNFMAYDSELFSVDNENDHWNYYNCNLLTYGNK